MIPYLKKPKNIIFIILIWVPVLVSFVSLESMLSKTPWLDAALLFGPVMFLELFIAMATWYVCKSIPLDARNFANLILKHAGTALIINAVWLQVTMMYSELLVLIYDTEIWRSYFNKSFPLLVTTGVLFYFLASLIHYLLIVQDEARQAEQEALQSKLLAGRAELDSLKATIHPHFLFNSLNALNTLTVTSPQKAQRICIQLSDFLRYSIQYSKKEFATVQDELDHIGNYLGVEQTRLGKRLNIEFDVDPNVLEVRILPFTLLPLVENSVKHGIQERLLGGSIHLQIKESPQQLFIKVSNPCDEKVKNSKTEGHGLRILKERLYSVYKDKAELTTLRQDDDFIVRLYIPLEDYQTKQLDS